MEETIILKNLIFRMRLPVFLLKNVNIQLKHDRMLKLLVVQAVQTACSYCCLVLL